MGALPFLRRGWTLPEMLISMTVTGVVLGLVARTSTQQVRFYRGVGELVALKGQIASASAVAAGVLRDISARGGDILVAQDSALELRATIGAAVACSATPGRVTIPAPRVRDDTGNTVSTFTDSPDAGDRIAAFFEDSLGASWRTLHAAAPPSGGSGCAAFQDVVSTWDVALQEPVTVPLRTMLRFSRPLRLSLYRASDNRWYLGAKTWNPASQEFNAIQPVAGPLRPYDPNPARTGLEFSYRDGDGELLDFPMDVTRIASITIVSRPRVGVDSSAIAVALRNAR